MTGQLIAMTVDFLVEAEENPRRISPEALERLVYSLEHDPAMLEARPLIVDAEAREDGTFTVVAGNMRLRAASEAILDTESQFYEWYVERGGLPVYAKHFDSPRVRREWMLRDNAGYGEWVPDELAALVAAHRDAEGDLAMLGFSEPDLGLLLAASEDDVPGLPTSAPDDVPKAPEQAVSRLGDVWQLGDHRLVCGDAALPQTVEAATLGAPMSAIVTDPPYGVDYDPEARVLTGFSQERLKRPLGELTGDDRLAGDYSLWLAEVLIVAAEPLRDGGALYMFFADRMMEWAAGAVREAGFHIAQQLVWRKSRLVFGRHDWQYQHEPIIYGWKPGNAHVWLGDRTQTTIIEASTDHYGTEREKYRHPTQKPYEVLRPLIENSTMREAGVLDPFAGSGSTIIACERLRRRCAAIELEPRWVDVAILRWMGFTGEQAELVSRDGSPTSVGFAEAAGS